MSNDAATRRTRGFRALLPDQAWAELVQHGVRRQHTTGERLLCQGEPGGWLLLCLAGRLKVVYTEPDGRDLVLAVRGPGDLLGEFSGRDGQPRSATVQAVEPGITSKLSERRFGELVQRFGLSERISAYIVSKMRESASRAWRLAHRSASVRLAELIGALLDAAGPDHPRADTIAMSQEELASALGLARSAITPVLAAWKTAGVIRTSRGRLHVVDPTALKRLAVSSAGQNDR
ncbi:Crp/Fnr family transcriptional regulator [Saccharopolyspora sp. NPDC047091]|uniref:Crp/Fnr family transcriptional regulator n=1 Tax=Saccharopolyspora sp. NPDC047091 TaxID=3155924 RepID=UPI0033D9B407